MICTLLSINSQSTLHVRLTSLFCRRSRQKLPFSLHLTLDGIHLAILLSHCQGQGVAGREAREEQVSNWISMSRSPHQDDSTMSHENNISKLGLLGSVGAGMEGGSSIRCSSCVHTKVCVHMYNKKRVHVIFCLIDQGRSVLSNIHPLHQSVAVLSFT